RARHWQEICRFAGKAPNDRISEPATREFSRCSSRRSPWRPEAHFCTCLPTQVGGPSFASSPLVESSPGYDSTTSLREVYNPAFRLGKLEDVSKRLYATCPQCR